MRKQPSCKICRREGKKLFLKGDRCNTPKCAMIKRDYPPGAHGQSVRRRRISEYAIQLREKQKLRRIYGLSEKQFKKYYTQASQKRGLTSELFIKLLETRLDNVVYRLGLASSRRQARGFVNHGHFLVNSKPVNIPSYRLKVGDNIACKQKFLKSSNFAALKAKLKGHKLLSWLAFDLKKMEGKIKSLPSKEELETGIDLSMITEFYSR